MVTSDVTPVNLVQRGHLSFNQKDAPPDFFSLISCEIQLVNLDIEKHKKSVNTAFMVVGKYMNELWLFKFWLCNSET